MNQQWKHAPSEASQVIHRFILRNQEHCKHPWGKGPVLNKIRSSEDLPKRQEGMVFYKTNLSQICHQISLVTTFSRTLQRLGFKVDNGQENTTVLKRKETKRQSITTTITKRKNRHSRATLEHPDMKGENIRAYSYHKKTWEFGARKIEELGSLTREKWNWSAERDREQNLLRWQESEGRTLERLSKQLGTKIGFDGRLFGRFWSFQRLCFGGDFCSSRNSRVFLPAFLVPFLGGGGGEEDWFVLCGLF